MFKRFVKYGIGPFLVLVSLQVGILYICLLLLVFGLRWVFTNHFECFDIDIHQEYIIIIKIPLRVSSSGLQDSCLIVSERRKDTLTKGLDIHMWTEAVLQQWPLDYTTWTTKIRTKMHRETYVRYHPSGGWPKSLLLHGLTALPMKMCVINPLLPISKIPSCPLLKGVQSWCMLYSDSEDH